MIKLNRLNVITGFELDSVLRKLDIEPSFADDNRVVVLSDRFVWISHEPLNAIPFNSYGIMDFSLGFFNRVRRFYETSSLLIIKLDGLLHPKYQVAFAHLLSDLLFNDGAKHIVIITQSDFFIKEVMFLLGSKDLGDSEREKVFNNVLPLLDKFKIKSDFKLDPKKVNFYKLVDFSLKKMKNVETFASELSEVIDLQNERDNTLNNTMVYKNKGYK